MGLHNYSHINLLHCSNVHKYGVVTKNKMEHENSSTYICNFSFKECLCILII